MTSATDPTGREAVGSHRPTRATELAVWLALFVALVGLLQAGTPPRVTVLSLIVVTATLAASLRWRIGWAAIIILLAVGHRPPRGASAPASPTSW